MEEENNFNLCHAQINILETEIEEILKKGRKIEINLLILSGIISILIGLTSILFLNNKAFFEIMAGVFLGVGLLYFLYIILKILNYGREVKLMEIIPIGYLILGVGILNEIKRETFISTLNNLILMSIFSSIFAIAIFFLLRLTKLQTFYNLKNQIKSKEEKILYLLEEMATIRISL